jgi:hypothetical protein
MIEENGRRKHVVPTPHSNSNRDKGTMIMMCIASVCVPIVKILINQFRYPHSYENHTNIALKRLPGG